MNTKLADLYFQNRTYGKLLQDTQKNLCGELDDLRVVVDSEIITDIERGLENEISAFTDIILAEAIDDISDKTHDILCEVNTTDEEEQMKKIKEDKEYYDLIFDPSEEVTAYYKAIWKL